VGAANRRLQILRVWKRLAEPFRETFLAAHYGFDLQSACPKILVAQTALKLPKRKTHRVEALCLQFTKLKPDIHQLAPSIQ
jgi:hypothetical protein